MSAFNSTSSLEPGHLQAAKPRPRPSKSAHELSEASQVLLTELLNDMKTRNQCASKLKSVVTYFASLFGMNILEIAAWNYLLRLHICPSDSLASLITLLRMTGYHVKSVLQGKSECYLPQLVAEDESFEEKYTHWYRDFTPPAVLSVTQVHKTYAEMIGQIHAGKKPKHTNKVVDEVLQVEICQGNPRKTRKTEIFRCESPNMPFQSILISSDPLDSLICEEFENANFDVVAFMS